MGRILTALAPWFGGKRTMAPDIVQQLGKHRAYFEPFCGSAAVLLAKERSSHETINDLHGPLVGLARTLADPDLATQLYERVRGTLSSTALFWDSVAWIDEHPDPDGHADVEAAYHFLVVSWQGRNGTSGCARTAFAPAVRFTPGGGSSSTRWRTAAESIPSWHDRLRDALILNMDAFELLPKIDDVEGVAIYADPPYLLKRARYEHDFSDRTDPLFGEQDDHARLAELLGRFTKARVVVSYYDHPRVRKLYAGWTFIDCTRQKNLARQNKRGAKKTDAPELLIVNGPEYKKEEYA